MVRKAHILCFIFAACAVLNLPLSAVAQSASMGPLPMHDMRILLSCDPDPAAHITPEMDWAGFAERDLTLVRIVNGQPERIEAEGKTTPMTDKYVTRMGKALYCGQGAGFMLIGKDRGPKRQWRQTVPIQELFDTIDAMPMRQYEMRTRGGN